MGWGPQLFGSLSSGVSPIALSSNSANEGSSPARKGDWRLFLPHTWDPASPKANPGKVARRAACGIPDGVGHVGEISLYLEHIALIFNFHSRYVDAGRADRTSAHVWLFG